MSARRHLRLVPSAATSSPPERPPAQLTFGVLTAEQRGADTEPLKPVGIVFADELDALAARLRARGGIG